MYLEKYKLDGRVAVVTGGGQGIGFACAHALAEAGAKVVVAELAPDRAVAATAELRKLGLDVAGVPLDVTKSVDVIPSHIRSALVAAGTAQYSASKAYSGIVLSRLSAPWTICDPCDRCP